MERSDYFDILTFETLLINVNVKRLLHLNWWHISVELRTTISYFDKITFIVSFTGVGKQSVEW